jgi:hypothetical protein
MREAVVVEAVCGFIQERGYAFLAEYPLLGKVADVYGLLSLEHDRTIAIECKERDWRRGLEQARRYQLATDEVFLAVPERVVTDELTQEASRLGVGLLVVVPSKAVRIALEAKPTTNLIPSLRGRALEHFTQRLLLLDG